MSLLVGITRDNHSQPCENAMIIVSRLAVFKRRLRHRDSLALAAEARAPSHALCPVIPFAQRPTTRGYLGKLHVGADIAEKAEADLFVHWNPSLTRLPFK